MKGYSDFYLLPLPKKNLVAYQRVASRFGKMAREHGALDYREFIGNDLFPKGLISFTRAVKIGPTDVLIAAVVDFKSRTHRDQVMKKLFQDPRMEAIMKEDPLTDMKKMYSGGFETIVKV